LIFAGVWATIVYFPSQGWVWAFNDEGLTGWIGRFTVGGAATIDWAGGTVVHISAGAAAFALALVLGQRRVGFSKEEAVPHNVPLVLIGAAILWFGWFGFNTGAATEPGLAGLIFLNTIVAPAAGVLGYIIVEHFKDGKPTAIGAASGVVAGLVAITPACANLTPGWAMFLGLIAGAVCCFAIDLKYKLGFDDSLDVVGLHLVAGTIGCLYLGFFATGTGLFVGGGFGQLGAQVVPTVVVAVYSFAAAWIIGTIIEKTIGFRVEEDAEIAGIDNVLHGGEAYKFD
jgi:Amt family ammonium transporter